MPSLPSSLTAGYRIARYHLQMLSKRILSAYSSGPTVDRLAETPAVTVFITNINNRFPLELTLRTLIRHTEYPNYRILVADNGSTDGSIEMVQGMIEDDAPIRLIDHGQPRPQHEWYDYMAAHVETPLWVGMHEDLMFIDGDWLVELVFMMEKRPDLLLLGGEYFPPSIGQTEPVSKEVVNLMESLSTWIFCARSELRDYVDTSFSFYKRWSEEAGRTILYDQGGKLIEDLRSAGLGFDCMPPHYTRKYQHVANISWAFKYDMEEAQRKFKLHQLSDVKRRVRRLQRNGTPQASAVLPS
jgi:glycosyltransferase involved in cell wall biosynthesis